MLCKACAIREEVLVTIYHEIAHICFDSFAQTTDEDKQRAIQFALKETKGVWADKVAARINNAPAYRTRSYIALAGLINEYLPFLLNCLEDARVNRELFKARPGVKRMFAVDTIKVFENGFENRDPDGIIRIKKWNEAALNSQAMIGVFCKASGYTGYSEWLHYRVVAALDDEEITSLINEMDKITNASGIYNLSFKVLARLRELGFCGTPQDPDPEPEPEPEPEEEPEEEQDSDADSDPVSGEAESDESDDSEDSDHSESEEPDSSDGGDDSEESDDASRDDDSEDTDEDDADGSDSGDESGDASSDLEDSSEGGSETADESDADSSGEPDQDSEGSVDEQDEDEGEDSDAEGSEGTDDQSGASESGEDAEPGDSVGSDPSDSDGESEGSDGGVPGHDDKPSSGSEDLDGEVEGSPSGSDERDDSSEPGAERDSSDVPSESTEVGRSGDSEPDPRGSESSDDDLDSDDEEPIDSGADDGYGGTSVIEEESDEPEPEMGTPYDLDPIVKKWGQHEEKPKSIEQSTDEAAVERAIVQGIYFTKPSKKIWGVREHFYGHPIIINGMEYSIAWGRYKHAKRVGQESELDIPEGVLQPSLLRMRRAFTDNAQGAIDANKKSGRVNARVLGRRAWNDDDRLFYKKTMPGKKDYFVVLGMDISGSTVGKNIALEKRAIMAQAILLDRVGIPFEIFAHTGLYTNGQNKDLGMNLEIYHIKDAKEPWNEQTIKRLREIGPASANLDGHALEFLRKAADKSQATNKIILYYSDGKMPAENHDEELEILQREIKLCQQKRYTLLGVGIRTDSPARHGLDTVEVNDDSDLQKVVEHLGRRLSVVTKGR
jgi:hypothetical protein